MKKQMTHSGILGMHWGRRKARNLTPSTRHLSKVGGTTSIVTRRFGDRKIIHRSPASPEQVRSFLEKRRKQKVARSEAQMRWTSAIVLGTYGTMLAAPLIAKGIYKAAWVTGKIVSNSPLN